MREFHLSSQHHCHPVTDSIAHFHAVLEKMGPFGGANMVYNAS